MQNQEQSIKAEQKAGLLPPKSNTLLSEARLQSLKETGVLQDGPLLTASFEAARLVIDPPEQQREPHELSERLTTHVRRLYGVEGDLAYHNWSHVVDDVNPNATILIERIREAGISIDEIALRHAILCHDLLYSLDPTILNFDSKEQLASHYAYNLLRLLGSSEAHARKVEQIINATHFLAEPKAVEEILIRAADLAGLAKDYNTFFEQTKRLHLESESLHGKKVPFDIFVRRNLDFLPLYVWRLLQLTTDALNDRGASVWHQRALDNLVTLFSCINVGRQNTRVVAVSPLGSESQRFFESSSPKNEFLVGIDPNPHVLEALLKRARTLKTSSDIAGPMFFLPGSLQALPISDCLCDELHITDRSEFSWEEARRVLKRGKNLYLYQIKGAAAGPNEQLPLNNGWIEVATKHGFSLHFHNTACVCFVKEPASIKRISDDNK